MLISVSGFKFLVVGNETSRLETRNQKLETTLSLFSFELCGSFFQVGFNAFVAVFAGKGLCQ